MRLAPVSLVLVAVACGPKVVLLDDGGESDDGAPATSSTPPSPGTTPMPLPGSTGGDDAATTVAGVDSSGGDSDPDLPEPPPLPEACPGDVLGGDVFSSREVYIGGTLSEGSCGRDAVAHWSSANDAVTGFDCYFDPRTAAIRPSDGRLLYVNVFEDVLREFHCDVCPSTEDGYPDDPLANDPILPTPACDGEVSLRFLLAPDEDLYLYACQDGTTNWYASDGEVYVAPDLRHLGFGRIGLTNNEIVHLQTGEVVTWNDAVNQDPIAVRADPKGGFLVVTEVEQPALLHVDVDGTLSKLGIYPFAPEGYDPLHTARLDGCGALLQFASGPETFEDGIIRRDTDFNSDVVYTESYEPWSSCTSRA